MIIIGPAKTMETVLKRDKKPPFSANMEKAMKEADFSQTVAFVANTGELIPKQALEPVGGFPLDLKPLGKLTAVCGLVKASTGVTLNVTGLCEDGKSAEDVKKLVDAFMFIGKSAVPPNMKSVTDLLDQIKTAHSGASVNAKVTITSSALKDLVGLVMMAPQDRRQ